MIEEYHFGSINVKGKVYTSDLIITPGGVKSWWREESHKVYKKDIKEVIEENPEIIVFGTGAYGVMKVLPETEEYLKEKGIRIIIKPSAEALKEYNKLEKEGKKVVGLFHLTC